MAGTIHSTSLLLIGLVACSDDPSPSLPSPPDAGTDAILEAEAAAPPRVPVRCTDEELSSGTTEKLEITFERGANPRQYTNRCATVKVGATVTFSGSFKQHPLRAAGGDTPNPIPYTETDRPGDKLEVVMPAVGTFGYECEFHPTLMFGAIRVVAE